LPPKEDKTVILKDCVFICSVEIKSLEDNLKGQMKILGLLRKARSQLATGFNKTCLSLGILSVM